MKKEQIKIHGFWAAALVTAQFYIILVPVQTQLPFQTWYANLVHLPNSSFMFFLETVNFIPLFAT